jgi:hypothetical protein
MNLERECQSNQPLNRPKIDVVLEKILGNLIGQEINQSTSGVKNRAIGFGLVCFQLILV